MTLPDEPSTFPKRTPQKRVGVSSRWPHASTSHSQSALDCPITRLRIHGLVGGDEHEPLRAELDGDVGDRSRDERVVADGLDRVRLDERQRACRPPRGRRPLVGTCRRPGASSSRCRRPPAPRRSHGSLARRRARARSRTSPDSPLSTRTSRVGPTRAIWRQSSEPIEPPAPVTRTTSPVRYSAIESMSTSTGSRPSRSSTSTGRICPVRLKSVEIISTRPGRVFTGTPSALATSTMRSRDSPEADGNRDQQLVGLPVAQKMRAARRSCRAHALRADGGSSSADRRR